jgi:hypothetical protein
MHQEQVTAVKKPTPSNGGSLSPSRLKRFIAAKDASCLYMPRYTPYSVHTTGAGSSLISVRAVKVIRAERFSSSSSNGLGGHHDASSNKKQEKAVLLLENDQRVFALIH